MQRSQKYRVGGLDIAYSGRWVIAFVGPVDHGGPERVRRALVDYARRHGPAGRIGLIPDPESSMWEFRPEEFDDCVVEIDPVEPAQFASTLTALARSAEPRPPVWIALSGPHAFCYLDHGVGDGLTAFRLLALVARSSMSYHLRANDDPVPLRFPAAAAVASAACKHPMRVAGTLLRNAAAELSSGHKRKACADTALTAEVVGDPQPRSAFSMGTEKAFDELERFKNEHFPHASSVAMRVAIAACALGRAGLHPAEPFYLVFDARRYLRPTTVTTGNFAVGLDLSGDLRCPTDITAAIRDHAASGLPALAVALHSAKSRLRVALGKPRKSPAPRTINADPWVTVSDLSTGPAGLIDSFAWLAPAEGRHIGAFSAPAGRDAITLTYGLLGRRVSLTASFDEGVFDPELVESAVASAVEDPVGLLGGRR
ncbi:hypothetical protein [Gordonia polyisoprenivorans]|uniref:hypothetical protein n=1 Tax=Gordonia polyisoprenivorans TaxID=84595 RepID=UPI0023008978|nr:hypothetical protein [Gordonia polyisoprenivorans]WCB38639.1 hypothetical protein PHA63_05700 [Gordonia polyisoprenivorans]